MTMKQFSDEAKTAHAHLLPLLEQAATDTQDRLELATQATSPDTLRSTLVAMLDKATKPHADHVGSILSGYTQLIPAHSARDGGLLIRSLVSAKSHNRLSDSQAGQIASAIISAVKGKGHSGLIEWPKQWHTELQHNDLKQWAEWAAPEQYGELMVNVDVQTAARISAEVELVHLQASRQALAELVPVPSTGASIKIRSNAHHRQGVAGIQWDIGEVKELTPTDYARLTQSAGYHRLAESDQLEVIA